jgi:hypothetical protein
MTPRLLGALGALLLLVVGAADAQVIHDGDVKYLLCPVCQEVARMLFDLVTDARAAGMDVTEEALIDLAASVCDPLAEAGMWLRSVDYALSTDQKSFELTVHERRGRCGSECLTTARTCASLIEGVDTEVAEALYSRKLTLQSFSRELCHELTSACSQLRPIKKPEGRGAEQFRPLSDSELEAEMMAEYQRAYGDQMDEGYGDEEYADEEYGYDDDDYGGGMPNSPMADSPLARLEAAIYSRYVGVCKRFGLPVSKAPLSSFEAWLVGGALDASKWVRRKLGATRSRKSEV